MAKIPLLFLWQVYYNVLKFVNCLYRRDVKKNMGFTEKTIESNVVYKGIIVNVKRDIAELHNGKHVRREVIEHPGGVGIVAVDEENNVIAVKQYRYPIGEELLEIPAGKMEYGEDPYECAVRELSEETGYSSGEMVYLGATYPSPGFCKETLHIYLARKLTPGKMHLDDDEFLNVEKVPLEDFVARIMRNEICDGKTIVGVLKAKQYMEMQNK